MVSMSAEKIFAVKVLFFLFVPVAPFAAGLVFWVRLFSLCGAHLQCLWCGLTWFVVFFRFGLRGV